MPHQNHGFLRCTISNHNKQIPGSRSNSLYLKSTKELLCVPELNLSDPQGHVYPRSNNQHHWMVSTLLSQCSTPDQATVAGSGKHAPSGGGPPCLCDASRTVSRHRSSTSRNRKIAPMGRWSEGCSWLGIAWSADSNPLPFEHSGWYSATTESRSELYQR